MTERVRARGRLRRTAGAIGWWLAWCVPLAVADAARAFRPGIALPGIGLGLLLAVLMVGRSGGRRRRWSTIGLRRPSLGMPRLGGAALLFVAYGVCAELAMTRIWSGPPTGSPMQYPFAAQPLGWLVIVLGTCLAAPLLEELGFRGQLQPRLGRVWGSLPAIVVTAAMFALVHAPAVRLPVFIGAILLGHARVGTRSIWVPVAMHFAHNAYAVVTAFANPSWSFGAERLATWALVLMTLLCAAACAVMVGTRGPAASVGTRGRAPSMDTSGHAASADTGARAASVNTGARAEGRAHATARALMPEAASPSPEPEAKVMAAGPTGSGSIG